MKHIFIINSHAGNKSFVKELREKIESIKNIESYIFSTKCEGDEINLVKQIQDIFEDEEIRIYSCGGSGTMRNVINGLKDISNTEVAFYPCGMTNDFLKIFNEKDRIKFRDIKELINGEIVEIDYLKTNGGVCINTCSVGKDSIIAKNTRRFKFLGLLTFGAPYNIATCLSFLSTSKETYVIETDNGIKTGRITEFLVCNGRVIGGNLNVFDKVSVIDGLANIRVIGYKSNFACIELMKKFIKSDWDSIDKVSYNDLSRKVKIKREDGKEFELNQDGELMYGQKEWEIEVVPKGLKLVVPKGVVLP